MDKKNENMEKSQNTEPIGENAYTQDERDFQLNKISCPSCGGVVDITEDQDLAICPFCRHQLSVVKESLDFTIDKGVLMKYNGESREVEVPSGVRAISNTAFFSQNTLRKIVLPEGLNELQGGFYGCSNLETVILPDSIENFPPSTFHGCISLKSVVLPKNLKNLGMNAFYDCLKLTSIEIPPMVESVETGIFMNCESLETIFCYENTEFGKDYNFIGCDSLVSINVLDSKTRETVSTKRIVQAEFGNFKIIEEGSDTVE
ncbi:MAG: leucine-rich repeat domain-containing protein [Methanobrevibacter sp.]|nr:leucine-rich repeat domain-containing protein [Methanobrevibacter sp.]